MFRSTARLFSTTSKSRAFNLGVEKEIRSTINALPLALKLYQNPDGTPRDPTDDELKLLSKLGDLSSKRKLSLIESFTLAKDNADLYLDNQTDLENLVPSYANGASGKIVDKVPYEDGGLIKWRVIRDNDKEGWEKVMYFGFVPAMFLTLGIVLFKPDDGIQQWAETELKLRAQEKYEGSEEKAIESLKNNISPEERKKRDEIIVERILSGEYDRLAGLKLKAPKLPISE